MADEKNINISAVPKFADKTLENIFAEPSKSIGGTFSDIWFLVLGGPVGNLAEKRKIKYAKDLEKYKELIDNKIEKIPEDKRVEPQIQVVGQILEASKYCIEDAILREMFANLLASSMNGDTKNVVHPVYSDILRKMTPVDASLFMTIASDDSMDFFFNTTINDLTFSFNTLALFGLIEKIENKIKPEIKPEIEQGVIDRNIFYDIHYFGEYINEVLKYNGYDNVNFEETSGIHIDYGFQILFKKDFKLTRIGEVFKKICF